MAITSAAEMVKKIDIIRRKRDQFNNHLQDLEQQFKERQRKELTKKKILVGAYVLDTLDKFNQVPSLNNQNLFEITDKFLTRKADRDVFGLSTEKNNQAELVTAE